jgi:hypothetical protein
MSRYFIVTGRAYQSVSLTYIEPTLLLKAHFINIKQNLSYFAYHSLAVHVPQ